MEKGVNVRIGSKFDKKGVDDARRGLGSLDDTAKATATSLAAGAAIATAGFVAIAANIRKAIAVIHELTAAYSLQESAEKRLEVAARNNPLINGEAVKRLKDYAAELERTTVYGDEVILAQQQFLVSLGFTEDQIIAVTDAAVNFAASGRVSLESAFTNISKTLSGLTGELGELVPALRDLTEEELKAGEGIEVVRRQFAGLATEMREETTEGSIAGFNNAWSTMRENMGGFAEGIIRPIRNELTSLITKMNEAAEAARKIHELASEFGIGPLTSDAALLRQIAATRKALKEAEAKIARLRDQGTQTLATIGRDKAAFSGAELVQAAEAEADRIAIALEKLLAEATKRGIGRGMTSAAALVATSPYTTTFEEWWAQMRAAAEPLRVQLEQVQSNLSRATANLVAAGKEGSNWTEVEKQSLEAIVEYLQMQQKSIEDQISRQGIIEDVHDENAEKEKKLAIEQARRLADIARYGAEYVSLQKEQIMLQGAMQLLIEEGFDEQVAALRERMGEIDRRMEEILTPPAAPALSLDDVLGGFEGVVSQLSEGMGGLSEQAITAMMAFGSLGLAAMGVQLILDGFTSVVGPIVNRILVPFGNYLSMIGEIAGTFLIPALNALSPLIMMLVQILTTFLPLASVLELALLPVTIGLQLLRPLLVGLAVSLEVLMSPIRFLADLFSWVAQKIRYAVVQLAARVTHPLDEEKRIAYIAHQGVADPGRFSSTAFSGLAGRIEDILALSAAAPKAKETSLYELLDEYTGLTEWAGPGAEPGTSGVYGGSVTVTQPPDIYIHIHIGEGGVAVMGDRELLQVGEVVVRAVEEVLGAGGTVTWLPAGV